MFLCVNHCIVNICVILQTVLMMHPFPGLFILSEVQLPFIRPKKNIIFSPVFRSLLWKNTHTSFLLMLMIIFHMCWGAERGSKNTGSEGERKHPAGGCSHYLTSGSSFLCEIRRRWFLLLVLPWDHFIASMFIIRLDFFLWLVDNILFIFEWYDPVIFQLFSH